MRIEDLEESEGWNWKDVLCGRESNQCELGWERDTLIGVELC